MTAKTTEQQREEDAQNARIKRANEVEDFRAVMGTPAGQRVMRRIIEQAGIFRLSFAGEHPHTTSFNEGARNIGLFLTNEIIEICPEKWVELMKG